MTFLANTDALIIDLLHNGGGSPQWQVSSSHVCVSLWLRHGDWRTLTGLLTSAHAISGPRIVVVPVENRCRIDTKRFGSR
jgi:hypothetical protein